MRRLAIVVAACAAVVISAAPSSSSAARHVVRWRTVPSPSPGTYNTLLSVSALSSTNAWAVGDSASSVASTLILHWDGRTWAQVASPNPAPSDWLSGVLARSPDDVWAVGSGATGHGDRTLIEHWDGSSWRVVPSPSPDTFSDLYGVFGAGTSGRLWAVGTSSPTLGGPIAPLIEEWNGSTWTVAPTPPVRTEAYLYGGTASSDDDAWVVGQRFGGSGINRSSTEHWDGTAWSIVPSANKGRATICLLNGAAAASASDVWAVGYAGAGPMLEHWDGSSWSLVRSPDPTYGPNAVAIRSGDSVWTAGSSHPNGAVPEASTERWDGSTWSVVPSPSPGDSAFFTGIAAVPGSRDLWAVGGSTTAGVTTTLIELYS